ISGYAENRGKEFNAYATLTFDVPYLEGLSIIGKAAYFNNVSLSKVLAKSYRLYTYDPALADPYIPHLQNDPSRISNGNFHSDAVTLQAHAVYIAQFDRHKVGGTLVFEQNTFFSRSSTLAREYEFYPTGQIDQASLNNQTNS